MTLRWLGRFAVWMVIGAFAGVLLLLGVPRLLHMTSLTVLSGSMEPVLHTGDVVIGGRTPISEVRVGDVITFSDPQRRARLVTHRVRGIQLSAGRATVVTQGDNNSGQERWVTDAEGSVGRVALRVPKVGYVTTWAGSRNGRLALLALPAALLVLLELLTLRSAWRAPRSGAGVRAPDVEHASASS